MPSPLIGSTTRSNELLELILIHKGRSSDAAFLMRSPVSCKESFAGLIVLHHLIFKHIIVGVNNVLLRLEGISGSWRQGFLLKCIRKCCIVESGLTVSYLMAVGCFE